MNIMKKQETTLVQRAFTKVTGFKSIYKRLEKKIIVSGKSMSTLNNYMRCLAHVALHFSCVPSQLNTEQIEEYTNCSLIAPGVWFGILLTTKNILARRLG
jgi:hypothetical protein